jgi:hypothetical protein
MGVSCKWYWLSASLTRVYAVLETIKYKGPYYTYVTHAREGEGRLGPACDWDFDEWETSGEATIDTGSDVLYKATLSGGLTAHTVEPDGRPRRMGASHLCGASTMDNARPLVAVGGFLYASANVGSESTTCSYEGPRLVPRANLGLGSYLAAAVAPHGIQRLSADFPADRHPTLLAMVRGLGGTGGDRHEIRLFAMRLDGDLQWLDTVEGGGWAEQLLFHSSGRALYVSHVAGYRSSPASLTVYPIDAQGHLEAAQTLEDGGGAMAVTSPAAVASAPAG